MLTKDAETRVQGILKLMGNHEFDLQAYAESDSYKGICRNMECMLSYPDEGSCEAIAYWRQRGLKKEIHGADQLTSKWASYLPVSWADGITPEKKYPLLFVMHGNNNPIYLAETYGYTHIAAREELITIIPENESAENTDRLLAYAKEHYPVDWSRVYMAGYSGGGWMTSRHALRWPERFAAVGVGGMIFANGTAETYWQEDTPWQGETITEEMIVHASQVQIPMCGCMGEQEFINILPLTEDKPATMDLNREAPNGHPSPHLDLTSKNKIACVNNWRRVAGCEPLAEEEVRQAVRTTPDIVTEKLGFPFEQTKLLNLEGRSHYIGECVNRDGDTLARFICMGKSPHWPSMALAELTWEYMRQFARNPETGELIRLS